MSLIKCATRVESLGGIITRGLAFPIIIYNIIMGKTRALSMGPLKETLRTGRRLVLGRNYTRIPKSNLPYWFKKA